MKFTWHEGKLQGNLEKHGLDFKNAAQVFAGATFTFEDNRYDYGETRCVTIGLLSSGVTVVVHSEAEEEIRIISMRKAVKNEQDLYFKNLFR